MERLETPKRLRLDSWKEIAAYLRKEVRTVQLWEKKEGLPVYRHAHTARATVFAYTDELDIWLAERHQEYTARGKDPGPNDELPQPRRRRWLIAGFACLSVAGLVALLAYRLRDTKPDPRSVKSPGNTLAVLPFEDLSPERHEDHLADGLTDDLIAELGRSGELPVISRRSSVRFKDSGEPVPKIAESLHANLIVEGTLVRSGRRVRITADLVDGSNDRHLWTQSYERELADVLSMQDEVAASIASAVTEKVTGKTPTVATNARPVDPEARTAYLTGRFFWNKRDEPGLKKAIVYFNQAIAKDPHYAAAYSGLADCYTLLSVWGSLSSRQAFPKAKAAALKALDLDPGSAEAYTSLAVVTARWDWNFSAAEQYFQKAIQANPNYSTAHQWYGEFLGDLGRAHQSIAESEKAVQLDPLSPMAGCDLSVTYIHAGMPDEAVKALQRVLTFAPDFQPAHQYLISAYEGVGQIDKAEEETRRHAELTGDKTVLLRFRIGRDAAAGRTQQAKREVEQLLKDSPEGQFGAYYAAGLYFTIGDKEAGYRELEKAYQEHSWYLVNLPVDENFDSVRKEARFRDLMRRVGLPGS